MVTKLFPALVSLVLLAATSLLHADPGDLDLNFVSTLGTGITGKNYPTHNPTGAVNAVALQPDGRILVGGNRSRYDNTGELTALKRLNTDGTLDTTFAPSEFYTSGPHESNTSFDSEINVILANSDGSFYIGGVFDSYGDPAVTRISLAKINEDGTLDTTFAPPAFGGTLRYVMSLALDGNGGLLVGGAFTVSGKRNLVRLDATTGALDNNFTATGGAGDVNATVDCISPGADGRIYVSGANSQGRPLVHRLFGNGSRDGSFAVPFANDFGRVNKVLSLPDGRVVIGGGYDLSGRPDGDFISGLTSSGALDTAFQAKIGTGSTGWTGGVLKLMPDGRILAGGIFTSFNGTPVASMVILAQDGTRDESFTPAPYTTAHNGYLTHFYSAAVQPDGMIVAGGWLDRVSDPDLELRNLVRFNGDSEVAGAGTLKLTAPLGVTTVESAGSVKVQVVRLPGLTGEATVNYTTGGGTALAGTHYTTTTGTLTWEDGEGGVKEISIPLTNNAANGGSKTFNVTLSGETGADLALPASTQVTILDDEAPPVITTPPANVTTNQGNSFTLGVVYDSVTLATLQWQFNPGTGFVDIPGAVSATYTVALSNPAAHNGTYRVVVFNSGGSATSSPATVTVLTPAGSLAAGFVSAVVNGTILYAQPDGSGRTIVISTNFNSSQILVQRLTAAGALDGTFVQSQLGNAPGGLVVLPDGRFVITGFFSTVTSPSTGSATARPILARFHADGSLDTGYSPSLPANAGTSIFGSALANGANGKFYAGFLGGAGMRRYNADGTLDSGFTAPVELGSDLQGEVAAVHELGNGKVLVAHRIGRNGFGFSYNIWRLNADGSRDLSFASPGANNNIMAIAVLPDGRVAIGGQFNNLSSISPLPMPRVALLDANGVVDLTFRSPAPDAAVRQLVHKNGRLLIAGEFANFTNPVLAQRGIARLNLDGTVDSSFVVGPGANDRVNAMFLVGNDQIFAAGAFTQFNNQAANRAVMLIDPPALGSVGFAPPRITLIEAATEITLTAQRFGPTNDAISIDWSTEQVAADTATAGADFTAANGTLTWAAGDSSPKTLQITLLDDSDVESTETFRVVLGNTNGPVTAASSATITILDSNTPVTFTTQPTGTSILAGQNFSLTAATTSPTPTTYQWHLNGNPIPGATAATYARTGAAQTEGGVYTLVATNAAGSFSSNTALVVISPAPGIPAADYAPQAQRPNLIFSGNTPRALAPLPDGGVYAGGWFSQVNGSNTFRYLVKVFANGTLDTAFNPLPNGSVNALVRQPDGKLLVGGDFTQINGASAVRLARLNPNGSLDTDFQTNLGNLITSGQVNRIALLSDGRIVVGGSTSGNYLNLIAANGTPDLTFRTNASPNNPVLSLAVQSNDQILVGGSFTNIGGSAISRFARLETTGLRDATFTNGVGGSGLFNDILIDHLDRIFAAGSNFSNGAVLAQASATGAFASNMGSSGAVADIHEDLTGKLLILRSSGTLSRFKGSNPLPSPGSADGDPTFTTVNLGGTAYAVTVTPDGSVWAAGAFETGLVKLNGDLPDPAIVNPPVTIGVNGGATAQFSVGATGTSLVYQWFKDGVPLTNIDNISGATSSILTISNVTVADDDIYTVSVTGGTPTNMVGSAPVKLNVLGAPIVVTSPDDVTPALGSTITLAAEVLAATPATYVWHRNGVIIQNGGRYSGADTATLVIAAGNSADNGDYILTVTNGLGTDASTAATVTVNQTAHARDTTLSALSAVSAGNGSNNVNAFLHLPDGRTLLAGTNNFRGGDNVQVGGLSVISTSGNLSVLPAGAVSGEVRALHLLANGKVLLVGNFSQVGGVNRNRIARLNADLTLDTTFNPAGSGAGNVINRLAVDTAGRIYLSGSFFSYDGINGYSNYVRLLPDGTLDLDYKVSFTGGVAAMAPLPDGKMLIGGVFSHTFNDVTTNNLNNLCRLLPSGAIDPTFTSGLPSNYGFNTFDVDSMGRIVVGANSVNGQAFYHLLRLLPGGGLDPSFNLPDTINSEIWVVKALANGQILVGGRFTAPTNRLFMVNTDGTRDTTFNVGTGFTHTTGSPIVTVISQDPLGRIWVGGTVFTSYNGVTANAIAVLQGQGTPLSILAQPLGQTLDLSATATFTVAATGNNGFTYQWRKGNVALANGGRVSGATSATLSISDIDLTDVGAYSVVVTSPSASITSANAELTILSTPEIISNPVSLTRDVGGTAVFAGKAKGAGTLLYQWFLFDTALVNGTGIAGATTPTLTLTGVDFADAGNYRLRVQNHLGTAFTNTANLRVEKRPGWFSPDVGVTSAGTVYALLKLSDGSILVGGSFGSLTINGVVINRGRIARFLANGTLDPNFTPVFNNGEVRALAKDAAGNIFVGGSFLSVNFGSTNTNVVRVAKLKPDLTLDTTFAIGTAGPNGTVNALTADEAGGVYAGGDFSNVGGFAINHLVRLNKDGGRVTSFSSPQQSNQAVVGLLRRPDGQIYVGGGANSNAGGIRLLPANGGTPNSAFAPVPPSILAIQAQRFLLLSDDSLLVSANGASPSAYLRRLNADTGASIANYNAAFSSVVVGIAEQPDGKMIAGALSGGGFARFNLAGTVDPGFFSFNHTVHSIVVDNSGRIWVGGAFNAYGPVGNTTSVTGLAVLNGGELDSRDGLLTPQTITFAEISNRTFNPAANSFTIPAVTSSSGLTVSVAVTSGPASISGNTVTILGTGSVTLTATQAGDATYAPASLARTFTVGKADQTINFAALGNRAASSAPFNLNATATSGLAVSYRIVSGPATLNGNQITLTGAVGTVVIEATQAGDATWNPAVAVQQSFQTTNQPVIPVAQTITWAPPASLFQGQLPFALGATASSGLPVNYTVVSGTGTIVNGSLTSATNGTLKIRATQAGNSNFLAASPVEKSIAVKANPTALTLVNLSQVYTGTPRPISVLGGPAGTIYYTINKIKGTTPPVNVGTYAVEYVNGTVKKAGSLVITKAPLRIIPDNQRRFVGQDNPALTFSYDGFLGSDTSATAVSKAPVIATTATKTSAGGNYPIKPSGGTSANYTFVYVNGTMTVETFAGMYEALLAAPGTTPGDFRPVGKVEITVMANSIGFTGKMTTSKELTAVAFKGNLTPNYGSETATATVSTIVGKAPNTVTYTFELNFELNEDTNIEVRRAQGAAAAQDFGSNPNGRKLQLLSGTPAVPYAGAHTLVLTPTAYRTTGTLALPAGYGYATGVIDAKGKLTITGALADGTKITAALLPDADAGYRLYLVPYAGRLDSYFTTELLLEAHPDLPGRRYVPKDTQGYEWSKAAKSADANYKFGFQDTRGSIFFDPWLPPVTKPAVITLRQRLDLNATGDLVIAYDGQPPALNIGGQAFAAAMDATGKVVPEANTRAWKMTVAAATGLFTGSHTATDTNNKPVTVNFTGIMRQPPLAEDSPELIGAGYGITPQLSGQANGTTSSAIWFE